MTDPLLLVMVRLRLSGLPYHLMTRAEFGNTFWPLTVVERCLIVMGLNQFSYIGPDGEDLSPPLEPWRQVPIQL